MRLSALLFALLAAAPARAAELAVLEAPAAALSPVSAVAPLASLPQGPALDAARAELSAYFADPARPFAAVKLEAPVARSLTGFFEAQPGRSDFIRQAFSIERGIPVAQPANLRDEPGLGWELSVFFDGLTRFVNSARPADAEPLVLYRAGFDVRGAGHAPLIPRPHRDGMHTSMTLSAFGPPTERESGGDWVPTPRDNALIFPGLQDDSREALNHRSPLEPVDRGVILAFFMRLRAAQAGALELIAKRFGLSRGLWASASREEKVRMLGPDAEAVLRYHAAAQAAFDEDHP